MVKGKRWARMLAGRDACSWSSRRRVEMTVPPSGQWLAGASGPHRFDHDLGLVDRRAHLGDWLPSSSTSRTPTCRSPSTGQGRATASSSSARARSTSRTRRGRSTRTRSRRATDGGIEYQELEVALDGITVMVNAASTIECLTTADLYAIFGPESDGIDSTTDANALSKEVGGAGNMPAQDLEVTAPGEESGTYDAFIDLAASRTSRSRTGSRRTTAAALRSGLPVLTERQRDHPGDGGESERDRLRRLRLRRRSRRRR